MTPGFLALDHPGECPRIRHVHPLDQTGTAPPPGSAGAVNRHSARGSAGAAHRSELGTAHEQLLAKAKQGRIDVYFVGDSIVRRWGALDYPELLANWKENFHGWNAANFGWGADRTQNILWRLENGELDGVNPKVIVILAGTNNVGAQPRGRGECGDRPRREGDRRCLSAQGARRDDRAHGHPAAQRQHGGDADDRSDQRQLAGFADGTRVRFLNMNDRLADADGTAVAGVFEDATSCTRREGVPDLGGRAQADPPGSPRTSGLLRSCAAADRGSEREAITRQPRLKPEATNLCWGVPAGPRL